MIPNQFDNTNQPMDDTGSSEQAGMPLGVDELSSESGFSSTEFAGSTKRHAGGALLLTAVVVVAIAGLFSMRTLTRASASIEAPTDVEKSIESFLNMIQSNQADDGGFHTGENETVLDILSASYTQRQVALTNVQRNPFIIIETNVDSNQDVRPEPADPIEAKRHALNQRIEAASQRMVLRSVLMGSDPLANIDNQVLRIGDSITVSDVTFTVKDISSASAKLAVVDKALDVHVDVTLKLRRNR